MRTLEEYKDWYQQFEKLFYEKGYKRLRMSITDFQEFRDCRRRWHFSSINGLNMESIKPSLALNFGTNIHKGLELYYKHCDNEKRKTIAQNAFAQGWYQILEAANIHYKKEETIEKYIQHGELGSAMLDHYFSWAEEQDKNWKVLATEFQFALPLEVESENEVFYTEKIHGKDVTPFVIEIMGDYYIPEIIGTIDLVVYDTVKQKYMVVDHKTSKNRVEDDEFFFDDQVLGYIFCANRIFKSNFIGCYNILRKKLPVIPKVLQSGMLSRVLTIDSTYDVYLKTMQECETVNPREYERYANVLKTLKEKGNTFFKRIIFTFNKNQLKMQEQYYWSMFEDVVNAMYRKCFYPNPTRDCGWKCDYKALCIALNHDDQITFKNRMKNHYQIKPQRGIYYRSEFND
jgi:hypothetical protein